MAEPMKDQPKGEPDGLQPQLVPEGMYVSATTPRAPASAMGETKSTAEHFTRLGEKLGRLVEGKVPPRTGATTK